MTSDRALGSNSAEQHAGLRVVDHYIGVDRVYRFRSAPAAAIERVGIEQALIGGVSQDAVQDRASAGNGAGCGWRPVGLGRQAIQNRIEQALIGKIGYLHRISIFRDPPGTAAPSAVPAGDYRARAGAVPEPAV